MKSRVQQYQPCRKSTTRIFVDGWFDLVKFGLVRFGSGLVWSGLVWFGLVWTGLVWFGLVCMVWFVWFGLVWSDLVWLDLVWFGLVWLDLIMFGFGLVWFGLVWSGFVLFWFDLIWFGLVCFVCFVLFWSAVSCTRYVLYVRGFNGLLHINERNYKCRYKCKNSSRWVSTCVSIATDSAWRWRQSYRTVPCHMALFPWFDGMATRKDKRHDIYSAIYDWWLIGTERAVWTSRTTLSHTCTAV